MTTAVQDAVALADAISRHGATPQALLAYEKQGVPECETAVERVRWLAACMQLQTRSPGVQAAARSAMEVVAETAIDMDRYGHQSACPGMRPG